MGAGSGGRWGLAEGLKQVEPGGRSQCSTPSLPPACRGARGSGSVKGVAASS